MDNLLTSLAGLIKCIACQLLQNFPFPTHFLTLYAHRLQFDCGSYATAENFHMHSASKPQFQMPCTPYRIPFTHFTSHKTFF